jgi:hypothetical protein
LDNVSATQAATIIDHRGIRELTIEESQLVYGGNPAGAALGAAVGAASYLGNASTTGDFSWSGLAGSTATGGLVGATGGASAFAAHVAPRVSFLGGAVVGAIEES